VLRRRATLSLLLLALAAAVTVAAARAPAPGADGLPERLADTGLYSDFERRVLAADVMTFVPQYPLWTDGATKRRFIRLPPGTAIDASDPDAWRFPAGTKLWKEFSFGRRVETRFLQLGADGRWTFASYLWSEDGRDACLAPKGGVRGACESRPGMQFDVPSRLDCLACHQSGASEVLGFSALQLSSDRDPGAPHADPMVEGDVDLAMLVRRGLVRGLDERFVKRPPRIEARSARERSVLGYLHANCGICHNSRGPLASLGLALDVRLGGAPGAMPPALATTLGKSSRFRGACRGECVRIAGGDPERSTLVQRLSSRSPLAQMPPLGSRVVDEEAKNLIAAWIREELAPSPAGAAPTDPTHSLNPRNKE
jgi:mono/diheme cytochrome c family protein